MIDFFGLYEIDIICGLILIVCGLFCIVPFIIDRREERKKTLYEKREEEIRKKIKKNERKVTYTSSITHKPNDFITGFIYGSFFNDGF